MGVDETLFALCRRWWRRVRTRSDPRRAVRGAELSVLLPRLRVFAIALGGEDVDLRVAESDGGVCGAVHYLPAYVDLATSTGGNVAVYAYRVAYGLASAGLGFAWDGVVDGLTADEASALAALLAVPATRAEMRAQWPGCDTWFDTVVASVLPLPPRAGALAALYGLRAGADPVSATTGLPPEAVAWVEAASRLAPAPAELRACVEGAARVLRGLPGRLPPGRQAPLLLSLFGRLLPPAKPLVVGLAVHAPAAGDAGDSLPSGSERPSPPRQDVERVAPARFDRDNPLAHVFEKLLTAEEYQGGNKRIDGADELAQHEEALAELDLRRVLRTRQTTRSIYRAEFSFEGQADAGDAMPATGAAVYSYPEWNQAVRRYRPDWCRVHVAATTPLADAARAVAIERGLRATYRRELAALRAEFARLQHARAVARRQPDGTDVDVDALVDRYGTLRAGGTVSDTALYLAKRRRVTDLATIILLDASMSTDAWVDGRRVLDVAREAIWLLGDVLQRTDVRVAIAAFHSNTRRDCQYRWVKTYDAAWSSVGTRLWAVKPQGYTRIGPALRHASRALVATGARRKLLLLLSDGKPMDYDRYEGRYGMADVRQALREAHAARCATFALAVEREAKHYLPPMFGQGGFEILQSPRQLPERLARVYRTWLGR